MMEELTDKYADTNANPYADKADSQTKQKTSILKSREQELINYQV